MTALIPPLRPSGRRPVPAGVWALACALCLAWPAQAAGTAWIWLDDAGRRVYSDRPPPPQVPADRILQAGPRGAPAAAANPASPEGTAAPATSAPAGTAAAAGNPVPPGAAANPATAASAAPAAETPQQAAQRRSVEARNAQIRADNCQRAQAALATLRSGARLATTNAQGRTVPMDAATRQAETERLQQIVAENCD